MSRATDPPQASERPREPSPRRPIGRRLVLCAAAVLVALVLLEVGVRGIAHLTDRARGMDFHPVLGWHMLPGIVKRGGLWCDELPATTNSHGWRDAEHPLDRVAGRRRILALGDSFTFGHRIDYGDRFTELLEQDLDCEVINMAACAYGTDQQLLAWETEGVAFAPDLALLTVFLGNDLGDIALERSSGWPKPWFDLAGGELRLVPPSQDLPTWLRTRSYLVEVALRPFEQSLGVRRQAPRWEGEDTTELFAALVRRLHAGVEASGARLLVALVHPRADIDAGRRWPRTGGIVQALRAAKIDFVDTFDAFRRAHGPELYLEGADAHWSPAGHRLMARVLAAELQRAGW